MRIAANIELTTSDKSLKFTVKAYDLLAHY